jgi:hypothetical protein
MVAINLLDLNKKKFNLISSFLSDVLYLKNDISYQFKAHSNFSKSNFMNNHILDDFSTLKLINDIENLYSSSDESFVSDSSFIEFSDESLRVNNTLSKNPNVNSKFNYFFTINSIKVGLSCSSLDSYFESTVILKKNNDKLVLLFL